MSNTTVAQFAAELNRPVDDLLKQLKEAGVNKNSGNDSITTDDKQLLTAYLQKKNGSNSGTISIRRKKTEVSTVGGVKVERKRGRAKLHVPQFTGKKIRVHQLSLLLVPIVGIDKRGYRLGQAGGYYDATLSAMKYRLQTQTLGVGFGCQLTDTLPTEPHDLPLDGFVSESGVLMFKHH